MEKALRMCRCTSWSYAATSPARSRSTRSSSATSASTRSSRRTTRSCKGRAAASVAPIAATPATAAPLLVGDEDMDPGLLLLREDLSHLSHGRLPVLVDALH